MNCVFRVDSSLDIGSGHVMRCLTVAEELSRRGVRCAFVCRNHAGNLIDTIVQRGFTTYQLDAVNADISLSDAKSTYVSWLNCDWEVDADQTKLYLDRLQPEWLIVDHYALDEQWEKRVQGSYNKLLVIDDIANRIHSADLLLDQNLFVDMEKRYEFKVPEHCLCLFGPEYALLQPDYALLRSGVRPRQLPAQTLLIFFGGADKRNLSGLTLLALDKIKFTFASVDIVVSKHSPYFHEVSRQVERLSSVHLHYDLVSLAPLMARADLAIGAGGATNWERFCLGLPSLIITLAENQRPLNQGLQDMGLIDLIGDAEDIEIDELSAAIENALSRPNFEHWSARCMTVCSGRGAELVADAMFDTQQTH